MLTRDEALQLCEIQHHNLPDFCKGAVIEIVPRKKFVIALNTKNTPQQDSITLEHELAHIRLEHF